MGTSRTSISAREFRSALQKVATEIVWKDDYRASQGESSVYASSIDRYLMYARQLKKYFSTATLNAIFSYSTKEFNEWIEFYQDDRMSDEERATVIAALRFMNPNSGYSHYVEHNPYYRMLMGLPSEDTPSSEWVYPDSMYTQFEGKYFEYEDAVQLPGTDTPRTLVNFQKKFLTDRRTVSSKYNMLRKFKSLAFVKSIGVTFTDEVSERLRVYVATSDGTVQKELDTSTIATYASTRRNQALTIPLDLVINATPEAPISVSINFENMNTISAIVEISYIDDDHCYQYGSYYYQYKGIWEDVQEALGEDEEASQGLYYSRDYEETRSKIIQCLAQNLRTWLTEHPDQNQNIKIEWSVSDRDHLVYSGGTIEEVRNALLGCINDNLSLDLNEGAVWQRFFEFSLRDTGSVNVEVKHDEFVIVEYTPSIEGSEDYRVGTLPIAKGDYKYDEYGKAIRIPVHLWDSYDIVRWENTDDYQQFISTHTSDSYQYLRHMTTKKIYPYIARETKPFDIMYCPKSDPESLSNAFRECYTQCRDMFVTVWYTDAMRTREGRYYESFSAMAILFMALNQMNFRYLDADIDRDFFDLDSLKIIYEAYSVPFYENIPLQYHKRVVKNINRLIRWKGSNKVFYELCDLFDYDILGIYQYYLLKTRQYDINGNPVVKQTQALDEAGQPIWETYQCIHALYDLPTYANEKTRAPSPYTIPAGTNLEIIEKTDTRYKVKCPNGQELWVIMDDEMIRVDPIKHKKLAILANTNTYENYDDAPNTQTGWVLTPGSYYDLRTDEDGNIIVKRDSVWGGDVVSIVRHSTNPEYDGKIYWVKLGQNTAVMMDVEWPTDNNGQRIPVMTDDLQAMYDVQFMKANIEENPFNNLSDIDNILTYESVTEPDSYWFHDNDTIRTMYENEYNFIETKYIGVQLTFELSKVMYESCYFMKMIHDGGASFNEEASKHLTIANDRMGVEVSLYDFILYIFAAICKKNGYPGVIPTNPSGIARVYGFNFKGIFGKLAEHSLRGFHIQKDYTNEDGSVTNDFHPWDLELGNNEFHGQDIQDWMSLESFLRASPEGTELYARILASLDNIRLNPSDQGSVTVAYHTMMELKEAIEYHLLECSERTEYEAWLALERIMYSTELIDEVWTKEDGTIASSFMDLLEDANPSLWSRLDNMDEQELVTEINYCLVQLGKLCNDLKYIEYIDGIDIDIITEYLYSLLRYFKSAKVDLVDFDLVFRISGRTENFFKLITDIDSIQYKAWLDVDFQYIMDRVASVWSITQMHDREFVFNFHDHIVDYYLRMYPYGDDPLNSAMETFHTYIPDMCEEVTNWNEILPNRTEDVDGEDHETEDVDSSPLEPLPHEIDDVYGGFCYPGCYFGIDALNAPHEGAFYGRVSFNPNTKARRQGLFYLENYGNRSVAKELWFRNFYDDTHTWGPWIQQPWDEEQGGMLEVHHISSNTKDSVYDPLHLFDDPEFLDEFAYRKPDEVERLTMHDSNEDEIMMRDNLMRLSYLSNSIGDGTIESTPSGLSNQVYYFDGLAEPTTDPEWGVYNNCITPNPAECATTTFESQKVLLIPRDDLPTYPDDHQQWVMLNGNYMSSTLSVIKIQMRQYTRNHADVRCVAIIPEGIIVFDTDMMNSGKDPVEYYTETWGDATPEIYYVSKTSYAMRNNAISDVDYIIQILREESGIDITAPDHIGIDPSHQAEMYQDPNKRWFIMQIATFTPETPTLMREVDHLILDISRFAPFLAGDELSIDMKTHTGFYRSHNTFIGFDGSEYWYHPNGNEEPQNLYCTQIRNDDDQYKADLHRFVGSSMFDYKQGVDPSELKDGEFTYDPDTLIVTVCSDSGLSIWDWQCFLQAEAAKNQGFSIIWKAMASYYEEINYDEFDGVEHMIDITLDGTRTVTSSNCAIETGTLRLE